MVEILGHPHDVESSEQSIGSGLSKLPGLSELSMVFVITAWQSIFVDQFVSDLL